MGRFSCTSQIKKVNCLRTEFDTKCTKKPLDDLSRRNNFVVMLKIPLPAFIAKHGPFFTYIGITEVGSYASISWAKEAMKKPYNLVSIN